MTACDGTLTFRDDVLRCEHVGWPRRAVFKCRITHLPQSRFGVGPVGDIADALLLRERQESQTTTRKPGAARSPKADVALIEPGECHCSACGQPCGTCSCPRVYVYKTTANQRRSDAARRDTPQRVDAGYRAMRQRLRDTGICIDCHHDSVDPKRKDGRCIECGKKAAKVVLESAAVPAHPERCRTSPALTAPRIPDGMQEVPEVRFGVDEASTRSSYGRGSG